MTDPYMYTDLHGDQIEVSPCEGGDGPAAMLRTLQDGIYVAVAPTDLAEFTTALHTAAGQPEPILLDRPTVDLTEGLSLFDGVYGASYERDTGLVTVRSTAGTEHTTSTNEMRQAAAHLAAFADLADTEPDPTEVTHWVELIHREVTYREDWTPESLARAIVREARKGRDHA